MTVTDIVELSKSRVRLWIDNEAAFVLYKSEISKFKIKKDCELPDETYWFIMDELLVKRAKLRCMNLLKSREYTRYQLETKLRLGFYPETVIEQAADYAADYGYLDDERYAAEYIMYSGTSKSKKQIENDLIKKGVAKQHIETAFIQYEEDFLTDEDELIKKYLLKKHFSIKTSTFEQRQKMIAFLYRKGFSLDRIYKVLEADE